MSLSRNAKTVLERFLAKDVKGRTIETPQEMFRRVAKNISAVDKKYNENVKKSEKEFFEVMSSLEFLPNIPVLANADRSLQQLAACFVLPVPDDLAGIFQAVKDMALIQKSGGGTGFSFSELRPEGSIVRDTGGVASGPVSFMKVFDTATGAIKEGGIRRGANMGILNIEHPDIEKFIEAKRKNLLENFNISVALTNKFIQAIKRNSSYNLIDPHTKKIIVRKKARKIFDLICKNAHFNGEPGVIFIDTINKANPIPKEKIQALNPCGEQPLLPYESCVLGSINLSKITNEEIDYSRLEELVKIGVHFLDNTIDASSFPVHEIEKKVKQNRKIGLGIMGFADCLIKQGISYSSEKAVKEAEKIMSFIQKKAKLASQELAKKRGSFPNIKNSVYRGKKMRNATLTTIAPTGTISILANCSAGIEPLFNVIFQRYTTHGLLTEFNPLFKKVAKNYELGEKELMNIAVRGSVKKTKLPSKLKKLFVTAHDISPEQHVKIQAAFQKYTDNAVSKTVNLPSNAKISDVKKTILLAHKLGCKGLTIYRDKSRKKQVLRLCKCKLKS